MLLIVFKFLLLTQGGGQVIAMGFIVIAMEINVITMEFNVIAMWFIVVTTCMLSIVITMEWNNSLVWLPCDSL